MVAVEFPLEEKVDDKILVYDIGRPEDVKEVLELFRTHFYTSAPIRQLCFWDDSPENQKAPRTEGYVRQALAVADPPVSLVVRDKSTGQMAAFKINHLDRRDSFEPMPRPQANDRSPGWLIRAILAELEPDVRLFFDWFKTDRILQLLFGLVRPDYRRLGINKRLDQLSYDLARSMGMGAVWHVAVSDYAGRNPANQVVKSVDYATFQMADDGSRPLAQMDLHGHKSARLIVRPISPDL